MIIRVSFLLISFYSSLAFGEELFVFEGNFGKLPNYREVSELQSFPDGVKCKNTHCESFIFEGKRYLKTFLLNRDNYKNIVLGAWSGGDCRLDTWRMDIGGSFASQYPQENGVYSWKGSYKFTEHLYIEDAINNDNAREWNEAKLYYVPINDTIIYKATRSLKGYDKDGKEIFEHYKGPDFFYFKRCKSKSHLNKSTQPTP